MLGVGSKSKPVDLKYLCVGDVNPDKEKNDVPIILIHGLSMNKESWKGTDEALAFKTGKRVYIPDLRNHGESPYTDEYDVETMADDIIHLMDKLKISKAIVLGHSLGGKIALHLALNYPTRIEKIIVEDMRPNGFSPESLEEVYSFFRSLEEVDNIIAQGLSEKETKERILKRMNDEFKKMDPPIVLEDTSIIPIKITDGKFQWSFNQMLIPLVLTDIKSMWTESTGCFDGPSLFIYGAESSFKVKDDENNIKRLFPNAQLFGVAGAGHMVHIFPEFMDIVIKFINGKEA